MSAIRNRILGAAVFAFLLWALQSFSGVLEFNRQQILAGEIWRIWSGHFVHTDMLHLSLNLAAALLIYFAFFVKIKLTELLLCSFVFSALISVTLLSAYSNIDWYNGLSGLLHGLLVYFSIRLLREGDKVLWLGLALVWIKVLVEMIQASMGYSTLIGDMRVISEAHLIGASIGTLSAVICLVIPGTVYRQFRNYLSLSWSRTPLWFRR